MPILDTVVLFGAADSSDRYHRESVRLLEALGGNTLMGASALLEFDVVLKSRGFSPSERIEEFTLLMHDFPSAVSSTHSIDPRTIYLAALYEREFGLGYFDSLIAAEATEHDSVVVSSDRVFDMVPGLTRRPLQQ